jgi:hypothetical protein
LPDDSTSLFAAAIHDPLELRRRNAPLEHEMPLARYMPWQPKDGARTVKNDAARGDEDTLTNVVWPEPTA